MKKLWMMYLLFISFGSATILQNAIDRASAGSTLKLSKGIYKGKITIDKPITIIGSENGVIIRGDGTDSVITVNSPHVTLSNIEITGSGKRRENLDAAVTLNMADHFKISHCTLRDAFYGIVINRSNDTIIENNHISSEEKKIPLRGDALKLWYSNHAVIRNNTFKSMRDLSLLYVNDSTIEKNIFLHNRLALSLSHSHNNTVRDNTFQYNEVGIMIMGGRDINVTHNLIQSSKGPAGIGMVADKVSQLTFEDNTLKYNTKALYIDCKRSEKGYQRFIRNNRILYNGEALHFHSYIKNNVITHNIIDGNLEDVVKDVKGSYTGSNIIEYNYWDRYEGFDRNRDNVGDTPYKKFQYADQLWFYHHRMKFFYGTPVMSLVNFLARLAPFSEPLLLLEDRKPLISPPAIPEHQ
ncbi:nitrous oxide reductase family maturation protein NosD [Sulfurovum riftiae]|uniref:Nitrous oxidase accessory protein n=1 Tax=Sulfurovum riftiae TaxID=1630136 RepID=A0A151CH41_9BACT|nr:nitrous oxide reductase family maturation protein NosD [Sulfurovum riftiae]KYJ86865.1 nitrous oxidase accessory protein [Sulfurovum riftiae]